jgi:hypothetical protein
MKICGTLAFLGIKKSWVCVIFGIFTVKYIGTWHLFGLKIQFLWRFRICLV